jgi:Transposase DDE domain group 1
MIFRSRISLRTAFTVSAVGGELDDSPAGGGEGRVPLRGVVSRVGFIVTNLALDNRAVVRFYNKRGTAEQWIKESKQAVALTRLSCHRFRANEVRLWLSLIAYNLGNLWRRLALPKRVATWSLTSLQQRLVKTGGRLIKHARYYWLLLAESHLTRWLFADMLRKIAMLLVPAG